MRIRMLQISCLLVLGLLTASTSQAGARSMWEGPCSGKNCTDCEDPEPSGQYCWVAGTNTCQQYGWSAIYACGEELEYAQCECEPCAGG
jgi:hypothetical protein